MIRTLFDPGKGLWAPGALAGVLFYVVWSSTATAIIVIDDFDDSSLLTEIGTTVGTHDVGELAALRVSDFAGPTTVSGKLAVATDNPGLASAALETEVVDPGPHRRSVGFHFLYDRFFGIRLHGVDFTEAGENDAVIVDLVSMTGQTLPRLARVRLNDYTGLVRHEHYIYDLQESTEPFQLVFPFDEFVPRGGLTGVPSLDFGRISAVELAFGSNFLDTAGQTEQWEVNLDRIWVGPSSAVPEPSAIAIVLFIAACFTPRILQCVLQGKGGWDHAGRVKVPDTFC